MSVLDFAVLPPEVNSGWMYAGPGSGPMLAAASAWDGLASELGSAASAYQSVVSELSGGPWLGPASEAMAAAATPYVAWMHTTATQAAQTASQARAAAAAYEAAFAATVPPPVIAANRASLASLVATNVLGQNSPAIAATQAHYGEMWAQDATAMHGYAAASAAATQVSPFAAAPQETNPAAPATQAVTLPTFPVSVQLLLESIAPSLFQPSVNLPPSSPLALPLDLLSSPLFQSLNVFTGELGLPITQLTGPMFAASGIEYQVAPLMSAALSFAPYAALAAAHGMPAGALGATLAGSGATGMPVGALGSTLAASYGSGLGGGEISASLGRAPSVGGLSVPQSWATAAPPEIRILASASPNAGLGGLLEPGVAAPGMAAPGMAGLPLMGGVNSGAGSRAGSRSKVMARMPGEPGGLEDTADWWVPPQQSGPGAASPLSDRERDELARLRGEVTELTKKRDEAARLIREAIRA